MSPAPAKPTSPFRSRRERGRAWPAALLPVTRTRTSSAERADVKPLHQEEGRPGMAEHQLPLHDGVSCAHQCRPLRLADRGRAVRRGVQVRPRSESHGEHLRTGLRASLRDRVPTRRNRPAHLDSRSQAFSDRASRSGVASSGGADDQAGRQNSPTKLR